MGSIAMIAAVVLTAFNQPLIGAAIVLLALGSKIFAKYGNLIQPAVIHDLAVVGVGGIPLGVATLVAGPSWALLLSVSAFLGSVLMATAIVQLCINSTRVEPAWALFSSCSLLLFVSATSMPALAGFCITLFLCELLWIAFKGKPSFKMMGIAQTVVLALVTAFIATTYHP